MSIGGAKAFACVANGIYWLEYNRGLRAKYYGSIRIT